ncbi:MAG: hypothetical protein R3338_09500, partial [Thermoanaerobaculia bacterium]|nr:hypothetical protein [Thermoanaerobaculia bacterium]
MKRIALFVLCLLAVATPAAAGELSERVEVDLELLSVLHQVRGMWLDPDVPEWKIDSRIDDVIDRWRGPLPDGGYEWVVRRRPATEVVSRSEQLIYGTRERLARIEEGGSWVYGVRLVVPRKRSLFRGNNSVWIEAVTIRLRSEEGEIEEDSIPLERWFEPNTSRTWEFEMIVPRADVFV